LAFPANGHVFLVRTVASREQNLYFPVKFSIQ
jgi:hypothetical protein